VDNWKIDASLGLAFSLKLFQLYKKSGKLQAELQRFPGIEGHLKASLILVEGVVTSCILEDKDGQQYSTSKDELMRFDSAKGPFEWSFQAMSSEPMPMEVSKPLLRPPSPGYNQKRIRGSPVGAFSDLGVPRIITQLDWKQLSTWTVRQQQILSGIWRLIDGRRTIREIKSTIGNSLPASVVDEAFYVLLELRVVVIDT
jgi:hypothetical protein